MAVPEVFTIAQNDTYPPIQAKLLVEAGRTAINLTSATAKFVMNKINDDSTETTIVNASATITGATTGELEYTWQTGDTVEAGVYEAHFVVTYSGGAIETFPQNSFIEVRVI